MNKRDMAACIREWGRCEINGRLHSKDICDAAASALEREADTEEKARKKVTLAEQASSVSRATCATPDGGNPLYEAAVLSAAADTLRRLGEEGPSQMADLHGLGMYRAVEFFRSLGVEPKP